MSEVIPHVAERDCRGFYCLTCDWPRGEFTWDYVAALAHVNPPLASVPSERMDP